MKQTNIHASDYNIIFGKEAGVLIRVGALTRTKSASGSVETMETETVQQYASQTSNLKTGH